jgi:endonuclease YncB( thermonuclease family)
VSASLTAPATYAKLKRGVEAALLTGQREIERAKVHIYWETGRLINEHILLNSERADYGAKVFTRLEDDLKVSKRILYQCAQFARMFPIVNGRSQLGWAHYRVLCQVEDAAQRKALTLQATKEALTAAQLEERIRPLNSALKSNTSEGTPTPAKRDLLKPNRGTPGLHLIVDRGDDPVVDLGFKLYRELSPASKLKDGDIVRLTDDGVRSVADATKAELFTYAATLRRVVDGDTLVVALEVAPGIFVEQKLRLRGLDCPEMSTPEGQAAKRFVQNLVTGSDSVVLSTTKPDKYDRYLADVFLSPATGEEIFLNNTLLKNHHAIRKDAWEFRDWEKDWL